MTTIERYQSVADGFSLRLAGVGADQWSLPTPCTDWTVLDLAAHVIATHRGVLCNLEGGKPDEVDKEGDLTPQWERASQGIIDALADETKAGTTVGGMFGEQTFESLVGRLLCTDTLVHSWDLARATGQPETLDPGAVEHCAGVIAGFGEAMRRPGGFGPPLDCPADADPQSKFLHFAGRAV